MQVALHLWSLQRPPQRRRLQRRRAPAPARVLPTQQPAVLPILPAELAPLPWSGRAAGAAAADVRRGSQFSNPSDVSNSGIQQASQTTATRAQRCIRPRQALTQSRLAMKIICGLTWRADFAAAISFFMASTSPSACTVATPSSRTATLTNDARIAVKRRCNARIACSGVDS